MEYSFGLFQYAMKVIPVEAADGVLDTRIGTRIVV